MKKTYNDLLLSIKNNDVDGVKSCLEYGVDPSIDSNRSLYYTSESNAAEIFKILVQHPKVDPRIDDGDAVFYFLYWGATNNYFDDLREAIQYILTTYSDFNWARDNNILEWATNNNQVLLVETLLNDPNTKFSAKSDVDIMNQAIKNNYHNVIRLFLKDGRIDPSYYNNKLLKYAIQHKSTDCIMLLLSDERVHNTINYYNIIKRLISIKSYYTIIYAIDHVRIDSNDTDYTELIQSTILNNQFSTFKALINSNKIVNTCNILYLIILCSSMGYNSFFNILIKHKKTITDINSKILLNHPVVLTALSNHLNISNHELISVVDTL
jgi:hypothetical protein